MLSTLDRQFDEFRSRSCSAENCVVSNQRPRTEFNDRRDLLGLPMGV